VITVTRNCVATVAGCLDSVAAQTYPHREHVVVDGASSDGTVELLRARAPTLARLVSEPDGGLYDALNKGLALAGGEVVGFLHADDVYAHEAVLERIAARFADPAVGAVYGDLEYVWNARPGRVARRWRSRPFAPRLLGAGWMPPHPTLYVRGDWYRRIGGFDTRYRIAADYHSVLRLFAEPGLNPAYLPEVLVRMRTGGASNRSLAALVRKSREDLDALRRTGQGGLVTLARKNLGKLGQFFAGP
jgi:glycosyltransferase involved in cell wall biosynthesis